VGELPPVGVAMRGLVVEYGGHEMVGAVVSEFTMLNEQQPTFAAKSVAQHEILFVPRGTVDPIKLQRVGVLIPDGSVANGVAIVTGVDGMP
jgi:hypothetical protein